MTTQKNRNNYMAITKAFGIIAVVVSHSCPPQKEIAILLKSFDVPLFFFISGFFFKIPMTQKDLKIFVVRKLKGLYVPFLRWTLPFVLLHNLFYMLYIYHEEAGHPWDCYYTLNDYLSVLCSTFLFNWREGLLGPFWFIPSLFYTAIFFCLAMFVFCRFYKRDGWIRDIALFSLFIIFAFIVRYYEIVFPLIGWGWIITLSACFFCIGFLYRKYEYKVIYNTKSIFILSALTLCGLLVYRSSVMIINYKTMDIVPYLLWGSCGTILMIHISKYLEGKSINGLLYYIGNNTMAIFALHLLCFKLVSYLRIQLFGLPLYTLAEHPVIPHHSVWIWCGYSIVGVFLPLLLMRLLFLIKSLILGNG